MTSYQELIKQKWISKVENSISSLFYFLSKKTLKMFSFSIKPLDLRIPWPQSPWNCVVYMSWTTIWYWDLAFIWGGPLKAEWDLAGFSWRFFQASGVRLKARGYLGRRDWQGLTCPPSCLVIWNQTSINLQYNQSIERLSELNPIYPALGKECWDVRGVNVNST